MENMQNEEKLSTSQLIMVPKHETMQILAFSTAWVGLSQKTISRPCSLMGPKLEIFVAEFFTQTKPKWVDDLETRKFFYVFGPVYFTFHRQNICLAISATALNKLFLFSYVDKKGCFRLLLYTLQQAQKDFFEF